MAASLGMTAAGRGGRPGRGGGAPGAALGGIISSFSGSGAQHGSLQRPTKTHQAALADAKAALATLQAALGGS